MIYYNPDFIVNVFEGIIHIDLCKILEIDVNNYQQFLNVTNGCPPVG